MMQYTGHIIKHDIMNGETGNGVWESYCHVTVVQLRWKYKILRGTGFI